ncbi:hypothetical protein AVEN_228678-1 [Araneus ventricosus]|uniref:Uncharacterized protein n=1 Tax=Araneus ventricosus TaxID=182803 RepID=A0A4Y2KLR0_ARAVE|nr:hypothetical protein AVEN_228678-1 [Araneus ventricosus]
MQGGFVHGRSTKGTVLTKFLVGLLSASKIENFSLENSCGLSFASGGQHVHAQDSRGKRGQENIKILSKWFCAHNPFLSVQNAAPCPRA